jgi:solute carrier family 34 (sodium-dependent phosphate cotransporter)
MPPKLKVILRITAAVLITLVFLASVEMIGKGFKNANEISKAGIEESNKERIAQGLEPELPFMERLMVQAANPLVGIFVGILVTSLLQSSSATTAMLITIVARGDLPVATAIPIVMGANIGTTVTNTLVALAHIARRNEFRRAIACSTMHDFFNMCSVLVILPLEVATGFLHKSATYMSAQFNTATSFANPKSPIKLLIQAIASPAIEGSNKLPSYWGPIVLCLFGVLVLFLALFLLTKVLKALMLGKIEKVLGGYLDNHGPAGILVGAGATAAVQSSSVTTSFFVPLAGAGVLKPKHIYPMVLGANLGTTITGLITAVSLGRVAGLTLAFTHLLFNICGILVFYPFPKMRIPIWLSHRFSLIAVRYRAFAIVYVLVAFYGIPLLLIFLT